MALTTLGSIIERFAGSLAAADCVASGGLWVGQIPEGYSDQSLPFIALARFREVPEWTFEKKYREAADFDFEIYNTLAEAEATAVKVKEAFDLPSEEMIVPAWPPIANKSAFACFRLNYAVEVVGERTSTNEPIFMCKLSYQLQVNAKLK